MTEQGAQHESICLAPGSSAAIAMWIRLASASQLRLVYNTHSYTLTQK